MLKISRQLMFFLSSLAEDITLQHTKDSESEEDEVVRKVSGFMTPGTDQH